MRVYSCWRPPKKYVVEKSAKPSITDRLACEDLATTVNRFLQSPYVPVNAHYDYVGDEQGALKELDEGVNVDVSQLDKVDAMSILADAERLAAQLRILNEQKPIKKDEKPTSTSEVVTDVADEPKDAN